MEANQILQSDILDILFDGKNKLYGAYNLRKTYNRRISTALLITLGLMLLAVITSAIVNSLKKNTVTIPMRIPETYVHEIPKDKVVKPEIPKTVKPASAAPTVKYTVPVITKKELVIDPPPDMEQIEKANIGSQTISGPGKIGIIAPPSEIGNSSVFASVDDKKTEQDNRFIPVEIEAQFPGGPQAWQRFIQKAINTQLDEFTESDYGTCTVEFTVDTEGNVSDVHALDRKNTKLAEIAVNAIKKGPKWTPAQQNGRYVTALRLQPVTLLNPNN
jgi:protein TonB